MYVDGIETSSNAHHVSAFFTEGVRNMGASLGHKTSMADGVTPISIPPSLGWMYSRVPPAAAAAGGLVATDLRNPKLGPIALW